MKWNYLIVLVLILLVLSGCTPKPSTAPPPEVIPPAETIPPTPAPPLPEEPKLPDLAWTDPVTFDPQDPVAGNKLFSVKIAWSNVGTATASPAYNIIVEILSNGVVVFEQCFEEQPAMEPGEERTFHAVRKGDFSLPEPGAYQVRLTLDSTMVVAESSEDNNIETAMITVSWPDYHEDMAAVAKAKEDIERYRKGDVTLTVLDSQGQPCSGITVHYKQTKHSFLFGVWSNSRDERVWSLIKETGINYVPIWFGWAHLEPQLGIYSVYPARTEILRQFHFEGMGHCLLFLTKEWSVIPDYIMRLPFSEFRNAIYPHIYRVVGAYKQDIKVWNVFNEPMFSFSNILGLTQEQTIDIIREGARAIRDADPDARILINNYNPGGEVPGTHPYDFLKATVQAGVDFDIIGLEFYYNAYTRDTLNPHPRRTLSAMAELIDKYSTLEKNIQITELSVPSSHIEGRPGYWGQPWSQELQAEYLVAAYTIFFSKPKVEGIIWWDATDKADPFIYHGALLDEQNQPKKAYYALKDLIESWTTNGTGVTDEKGQISFRGFGGTYEVVVSDPETGLSKKQEITVEEQKDNLISIVFD